MLLKLSTQAFMFQPFLPLPPVLDLAELVLALAMGVAMVVDWGLDPEKPWMRRPRCLFGTPYGNVAFLASVLAIRLLREGPPRRCIRTAVRRRRRGGGVTPPGPPPILPFQCLRLTAKFLLRCLRGQEDFCFKNFRPAFGGDHRGRGSPPLHTPPSPPF